MERKRKNNFTHSGSWRVNNAQMSNHNNKSSGDRHRSRYQDIKANQVNLHGTMTEIPGFYFDSERRKYFKITSSHPAPKTSSLVSNIQSSVNCETIPRQNVKKSGKALLRLAFSRQQGLGYSSFQRNASELCIRNLKELDIWPPYNTPGNSTPHNVRQIEGDLSNTKLLRIWRSGNVKSKIQKFSIKRQISGRPNLTMEMVGEIVPQLRNSPVMSVSWSPHELSSDLFVCSLLGNEYTKGGGVQLCSWDGSVRRVFYSRHKSVWTSSWNTNSSYSHFLSMGGSRTAAVIDLNSMDLVNHLTTGSDIFSTVFSSRDSILYCGARNGHVLSWDFRTNTSSPMIFKTSYSVSCVRLIANENYLFVGALDGSIRKVDIRFKRNMLNYSSHSNDCVQSIPFDIDKSETFLYAACVDGTIKIWSLESSHLLHAISSTNYQSGVIPAVTYKSRWGGPFGPPGFLSSVGEQILFYSLF